MSSEQLDSPFLFTWMLRYRMARTINMDVNILDPIKALEIDDYSVIPGQFVGFFTITPGNRPTFVLLGRSNHATTPESKIDRVFVYHVNHSSHELEQDDKTLLLNKVPADVKWRKMNILTDVLFAEMTILFTVVEREIHPRIFRGEWLSHVITVDSHRSRMLGNLSDPPDCNEKLEDPVARRIWRLFKAKGLLMISIDADGPFKRIPIGFDLMRIRYLDHFFYVIHYKSSGAIMLLIPHVQFFSNSVHYDDLISLLTRSLGNHPFNYVGITRFVGPHHDCSGHMIARACMLAVLHPQITIRPSDMTQVITDDYLDSVFKQHGVLSPQQSQGFATPMSSQAATTISGMSSQLSSLIDVGGPPSRRVSTDDIPVTNLGFDEDGDTVEILSVEPSSQDTIIMPQSEIDNEIEVARVRLQVRRDLAAPFPIARCDGPRTITSGLVVETLQWFYDSMELLMSMSVHYATSTFTYILDRNRLTDAWSLEDSPSRFIYAAINAINGSDGEIDGLIIIDKQRKEWVYVDPTNPAKDEQVFQAVARIATTICPDLTGYECWAVRLTSVFHPKYTCVHLVMATYTLITYFRYAVRLPQKIIYGEREFREYVHECCWFQRIINHQHNLKNGLVKISGYYKEGAFTSHFSYLDYHRSVVPKGQCPFCCTRGIKRLAHHMRMEHGDGAARANAVKNLRKQARQ